MTRKDYRALVKALAEVGARSDEHGRVIAEAVVAVAKVCAADNARFDRDTFFMAYNLNRSEFAAAARIAKAQA